MARESNVPAKKLFPGENKKLYFPVTAGDNKTPEDASGWSIDFFVRKEDLSSTVLIQKSTTVPGEIAVTGVYDPDPAVNTQRIEVTLESADTALLKPRVYRFALERVDVGVKSVLAFGDFNLSSSAAR